VPATAAAAAAASPEGPESPPPALGPAPPLLEVDRVTLRYKSETHLITATDQVSFQVRRGERFILLGPSGCGKSSLLKAVAGFISPLSGAIRLNGRVIERPGADRMIVFQEFDQLLAWKTVLGNVMFPLTAAGVCRTREEARRRALAAIAEVGLAGFADAYPHMLSGGMKQRVAIARALAVKAEMLLMDEPFAALDALNRRRMQEELLRLWSEVGFTMLFVTHSIEEAILLGSRIVVLSPHPGRVQAELVVPAAGAAAADFAALHQQINSLLGLGPDRPGGLQPVGSPS